MPKPAYVRAFFIIGRKVQESAVMSAMICGRLKAPILSHGYRTGAENSREQTAFSTHQCFSEYDAATMTRFASTSINWLNESEGKELLEIVLLACC